MDSILFLSIVGLAFVFELMDSAFGQGYGTLGSPALLLLGFSPQEIVPGILLSQAAGGLIAGLFHHNLGNVDFRSQDLRKTMIIALAGILGVMVSSFIGARLLSKSALSLYISCMVIGIGVLLTLGYRLSFTWRRLYGIGLVSAFNKGMSGGGYGPLVTGGQVIIGEDPKAAVGITDLAEAPICITGFLTWAYIGRSLNWDLIAPLCLGAGVAPVIGAYITKLFQPSRFRKVLGIIIFILGLLALFKILNP